MKEIWKDIDGYEGLYQVSNYGRVISLNFGGKGIPRERKRVLSSSKYYHVALSKNGERETRLVHVLVATAFIPNPENKPQVNHIDGNKENNRADNLEWVTCKENIDHAIRTGLKKPSGKGGRCGGRSKSTKITVLQYDYSGNLICGWNSQEEAAKAMGCSQSSICKCILGERKTCKGYIWKKCNGNDYPDKIDPFTQIRKRNVFRKLPQKSKRKCQKIGQYDLNGVLLCVWDSYLALEKTTGFDNGNIYKCIRGKIKSAYGYLWRYENG